MTAPSEVARGEFSYRVVILVMHRCILLLASCVMTQPAPHPSFPLGGLGTKSPERLSSPTVAGSFFYPRVYTASGVSARHFGALSRLDDRVTNDAPRIGFPSVFQASAKPIRASQPYGKESGESRGGTAGGFSRVTEVAPIIGSEFVVSPTVTE